MRRVVTVTLVACVALAGCTGGKDEKTETSAPVSSSVQSTVVATVSASPSAVESSGGDVATEAQYASLVAEDETARAKAMEDAKTCALADEVDPLCSAHILTVGLQAETLSQRLTGAQKPGVPAFIGAPPDSIKSLVDETIAAADDVKAKADRALDCTGSCSSDLAQLSLALSSLQSKLDAWGPYQ